MASATAGATRPEPPRDAPAPPAAGGGGRWSEAFPAWQREERLSLAALVAALRRRPSRLAIRLLAFNLLLVFLPALGLLSLDTYERQLLEAQERSMVQQGRLVSAALCCAPLDEARARTLLARTERRLTSRLRVVDGAGRLLADTARLGPRRKLAPEAEPSGAATRPLYRVGAWLFRLWDRLFGPPRSVDVPEYYDPAQPLLGAEVLEALAGRYGSAYRQTPGQRSVTLYSAIPIRDAGAVVGVVLVSQSTLGLLRDLYELRLAIFEVTLVAVGAAVLLTLVVGTTIVGPLQRLRAEAATLLDRSGRLRGRFRGSQRRDEIGDLARALEELSRRLGEHLASTERFVADLSHEVKNPLASIRSASQMLAEVEEPDARRRFLRLVEGEIARLERLVGALREVAMVDAGIEEEARRPVDLRPLCEALAEAVRVRGQGEVELRLPAEPLTVEAVPDRLVQAIENVLDNALSFSPAGQAVELELLRRDGLAVVRVLDRGPGIPPEHLERIFDRFFTWRPDQPGARRRHTGLGLAIVRAIAEGYGGAVVAANRPGGGAEMEIRLPVGA